MIYDSVFGFLSGLAY